MNNRGQFSIIAALFVAIILIATVVITYSTIRNSPLQDQPLIQSAIDETNFAIKQILGFTIGYYGSILKVTGNLSYARQLSMSYLESGLVNIASMHPEWGPSFDVSNSNLNTYWFTSTSYSTGNLTVAYNLTGLGISGITYETSCRLSAQVLNTTDNQAFLVLTKDQDEPLINLGKSDFNFYRYLTSSSTWELINPTNEPIAYANGTYQIDIPSGVDPYSYVLQVEDQRGIIVVASSFSKYVADLSWSSASLVLYAVTGNVGQITGVPDGNFAIVDKGATCQVTDYQGGNGTIRQVYFNITYYGTVSGTLAWASRLDGGSWISLGNLDEGGSAGSSMRATYNATGLRGSWTWTNLNATDIQFQNNDDGGSESAWVDAMYVTVVAEIAGDYSTIQNETVTFELLQNGSMRWLGQNLQLSTQGKPFPPVPVKAIHVNQTVDGVNSEVPFQTEDWTSEYRIPLGLTNNASVFSSRTMLVFLATPRVSRVTIWWDGDDRTNQTSYAFVNRYFTGDDPSTGKLTNGKLTLRFESGFTVNSTVGTSTCDANFMRINNEASVYGSSLAYVVTGGVVRDIIHQEAEWNDGADNSPNLYAHIVLTLPAKATYYTYQLRLMFVQSQQTRIITNLSPIRLTSLAGTPMTENGTQNGLPTVSNTTEVFYNYSATTWEHHWSQFVSGNKGVGIMFTSSANERLYAFDPIAGSKTGALRANATSDMIELLPVVRYQVSFTYALDLIWHGAVVMFDNTTPIYRETAGVKTGLWVTVEYPPSISVSTQS